MYIYMKYFMFMIGINFSKGETENPRTMSVVVNKESSIIEDYIQIKEPLTTISGACTKVTVEYRCTGDKFIGVEIVADTNIDVSQKIFKKVWRCRKSDELTGIKLKKVKLKLPPDVAYNYNAFNKLVTITSRSKLRVWMLDSDWWPTCFRQRDCYTRSSVKVSYNVQIAPPFSRPFYKLYKQCKTWEWDIVSMATSDIIPTCPYEEEIIEAIKYPVVLGGDAYGVYRQFRPYINPDLEKERQYQFSRPMFTLSMWLYILEYCRGPKLCSIMHHFTWNGEFRTILLLLTPEGRVHIQIQDTEGHHSAGLSNFSIPQHQWIRLILQFRLQTWRLIVNHGENFKEFLETDYRHPGEPTFYDDAKDLFTFGGSEYMPSFKGYIGQATIYRNKIIEQKNIPMPSKFHPMFELELTRREEKCSKYLEWVTGRISVHKKLYMNSLRKLTCRHPFLEMVQSAIHYDRTVETLPTCKLIRKKNNRHRKQVDRILKKMVWDGKEVDFKQIADLLYNNATSVLDERLDSIREVFPVLKQAACYGNMDAMYMISIILNNGIYMKADEIQSQAYLMLAALDNHRLAALALGHKHRYGIDGVTEDWEQSYRYYKFVADTTNLDKERHKDTDVFTESIRLTDEVAIHEQTDEDGDVFHWLTHQAKQGVLSAQNRIGRALFWGQQGLERNLASAVEYFKMSAETGDAQSQYDYGIVLMRGQGVKKDIQAGLNELQKAANQENPAAINAIGWHAMNYEQDMMKAAEQYEMAYRMGNPDAAYNLGILYLYGTYPKREKDADRALEYFLYAAGRGQMDAGVAVAYQAIKGTSRQPRNVYTAIEWARFIAEKNPSIGLVLRKALKAYRKGNSDVSLFYYALAADAGLEVGSFNNAWLCEENKDGITSFIEKECVWSRYNMSTQREPQFVDPYGLHDKKMGWHAFLYLVKQNGLVPVPTKIFQRYIDFIHFLNVKRKTKMLVITNNMAISALLKMGDYYWYGCEGVRNSKLAATYYAEAAKKNDPQALFNLGFMIEEGVDVPARLLRDLRIPGSLVSNNVTLLEYLYTRCKDSQKSEAYVPCSIALWRIQALAFWTKYRIAIKLTSFTGIAATTALSIYILVRTHLRGHIERTDSI